MKTSAYGYRKAKVANRRGYKAKKEAYASQIRRAENAQLRQAYEAQGRM